MNFYLYINEVLLLNDVVNMTMSTLRSFLNLFFGGKTSENLTTLSFVVYFNPFNTDNPLTNTDNPINI